MENSPLSRLHNGDIICCRRGDVTSYGCYDDNYVYCPVKEKHKWIIRKISFEEFKSDGYVNIDHFLSSRDELNPHWQRILISNQWLTKTWYPEREENAQIEFVSMINGMKKTGLRKTLPSITGGLIGFYLMGIPGTIIGSTLGLWFQ